MFQIVETDKMIHLVLEVMFQIIKITAKSYYVGCNDDLIMLIN